MYKCKHFIIQELVSPGTYHDRGELSWELFDDRMLRLIDRIKEKFHKGTMTINNWYWGGDREWSGFRTPDSPYFSQYSQHNGRAFDAVFSEYSADYVRTYITQHPEEFPELQSVELGVNWLHGDVRNCDRIKTYTP